MGYSLEPRPSKVTHLPRMIFGDYQKRPPKHVTLQVREYADNWRDLKPALALCIEGSNGVFCMSVVEIDALIEHLKLGRKALTTHKKTVKEPKIKMTTEERAAARDAKISEKIEKAMVEYNLAT